MTDPAGQIWSFISLGSQAAPVVGGVLYRYFNYEGIFGVSIALLSVDLILRLLVLERKLTKTPTPDQGTDVANVAGHVDETSPLIAHNGSAHDELYVLDVSRNFFLDAFPIARCFKHSGLLASLFATFIQAFIFSTFDATIPLIAIRFHHLDSFSTGLLFLALGVPEILIGPVAGWLVYRRGTKFVAVIAWSILGLGTTSIAFQLSFSPDESHGNQATAIFATLLAVCGVGIAATGAPTLTEASKVVERYYETNKSLFGNAEPYALLFGINGLIFNAGFSTGPLLAAYMKPVMGFSGVYFLLGGVSTVAAACSILYLEKKR